MLAMFNFDNRFSKLSDVFFTKLTPERVSSAPSLVHLNDNSTELLGVPRSFFSDKTCVDYFSGNCQFEGAESLAMVYSGHQFGQWAGQLGDGRALLLGQVLSDSGALWDVQLKGGGRTPYSRFGDGRAVMRSSIREYLCAEAMAGLGIPTTRSLCLVGTNELVQRETREPGAILTRLSRSFIRFGHFEHFFYHYQSADYLSELVGHVIATYFPEFFGRSNHIELWFGEVVRRSAVLCAHWQAVGFAHGVLNTDNMSILGETLDYGPFGFMESFDPGFVCNHSDDMGRYAFDQQPGVVKWNLHALAYALSPLLPRDLGDQLVASYEQIFDTEYTRLMMLKLGVSDYTSESMTLLDDLLGLMVSGRSDYTLTFRYLSSSFSNPREWIALFSDQTAAGQWLARYHQLVGAPTPEFASQLNRVNPKYVLRNWVAEVAIREVEDKQNYDILTDMLHVLHHPYDEHITFDHWAKPAPETYRSLSVSCSS